MPINKENKQTALSVLEKANNGEIQGIGKIIGGTVGGLSGGSGGLIIGEWIGDVLETFVKTGVKVWINHKNQKQEMKLAEAARRHEAEIEKNRQDFIRSLYQEYAKDQRELAKQNHQYRIEEQKQRFEQNRSLWEEQQFLNDWPLLCKPWDIPKMQISADNGTPLQIIYAPADNTPFREMLYPKISSELRKFTDRYHNNFASPNLVFYHNGYKSGVTGGAVNLNIRQVLSELPVVILETNVVLDEIEIQLTMWGLGCSDPYSTFVCSFPFDPQAGIDTQKALTDALLAVMKSLIGYVYDAYSLFEFARIPLFTDVARYEQEKSVPGCILNYPQEIPSLGLLYEGLYNQALASLSGDATTALIPANSRQAILYRLRLDYAKKVRPWVSEETYLRYLKESLEAWVYLRSEKTPEEFMKYLYDNRYTVTDKYFADEDKVYFMELCEAYPEEDVNADVQTMTEWLFCSPEEKAQAMQEFARMEAEKEMEKEDTRADKVFECYYRAAGLNDPVSILIIGFLYHYGIGVKLDLEKAYEFYSRAADMGNEDAANNIRHWNYSMQPGISLMWSINKYSVTGVIKKTDNSDFNYRLGKSFNPKFHKLFHDWYKAKADQGDAVAQFVMGCCYEKDIYHIPMKKLKTWKEKEYDIEYEYDPYEDVYVLHDKKSGRTYYSNVDKSVLAYDIVEKTEYVDVEPDDLLKQAIEYYQKAADQGHAAAAEKLKTLR